jgi:hypothetical protein
VPVGRNPFLRTADEINPLGHDNADLYFYRFYRSSINTGFTRK